MPFFDIDPDPAFCCRLEGCSLSASLISWTSPVVHYAVCNITYLANFVTTLLYFFSPCPFSLCQVLLQAWGLQAQCKSNQLNKPGRTLYTRQYHISRKIVSTLVSLFSPCPSPLCRVLLQAWGRYIYCTLGQDWPNTKSTVSIEEWLCYFLMCHFHSLFFVTIVVFVFTFVFVLLLKCFTKQAGPISPMRRVLPKPSCELNSAWGVSCSTAHLGLIQAEID